MGSNIDFHLKLENSRTRIMFVKTNGRFSAFLSILKTASSFENTFFKLSVLKHSESFKSFFKDTVTAQL